MEIAGDNCVDGQPDGLSRYQLKDKLFYAIVDYTVIMEQPISAQAREGKALADLEIKILCEGFM